MHLNQSFLLYFIEILMVSNLGIEMDNEMSKLGPLLTWNYEDLVNFEILFLIPIFDMCFYIAVPKEHIKIGPNFDSFLVLWQGGGILLFVFSLCRCTVKKIQL